MSKFKLYYAAPIDENIEVAKRRVERFKNIFKKYNIKVYGAGINKDSPILTPKASIYLKNAIVAYDLREIRECDIFLLVLDSSYGAGCLMELEYARQLGLYCIIYWDSYKPMNNIFLRKFCDNFVTDLDYLESILEELQ